MDGQDHILLQADCAVAKDGAEACYPSEYLNLLTFPGFPLHHIELKVGCPVVLLRNLSPGDGLCNGARLIVSHIGLRVLHCLVLGGSHGGKKVLIPRFQLTTLPGTDPPFTLQRVQIPIRLTFAMTINKAQGQSLPNAGIDLSIPCFAQGQWYVALSRATRPDTVKVFLPAGQKKMSNIIYQDVLTNVGLGNVFPEQASLEARQ